jgi:hypothetical protein
MKKITEILIIRERFMNAIISMITHLYNSVYRAHIHPEEPRSDDYKVQSST